MDQNENDVIHDEMFELRDAFKAREMELVFLREHCESLKRTVEQQAEIIARLYATDWRLAESIVTHCNTEAEKGLKTGTQRHGDDTMNVRSSAKRFSITEKEEKCHQYEKSLPGQSVHVRGTDASSVLYNQLKGMGFQHAQIKHVIDDCLVKQCQGKEPNGISLLNKALDYLVVPKSSKELARCNPEEKQVLLTKRDVLCTTHVSPKQHEVALSAAFLRRSNRKLSARPSVRDFGLLESDVDGSSSNTNSRANEHPTTSNQGNDGLQVVPVTRSRSSLFQNMDTIPNKTHEAQGGKIKALELGYVDFMNRLRQPDSRDLYFAVRLFVESILGPKGDGSPPSYNDRVIYTFRGTQKLRARCHHFFQGMEDRLGIHPAWRQASEKDLQGAREWIEKFVMDKVFHFAMFTQNECKLWEAEDRRLARRMKILQFITPEMLDIKQCMQNEIVWSMAQDELRRINGVTSPGDKIGCIERCCNVIFSVLSLSRGASESRPGADDFLPLFIYIVLRSQIPQLYSNCEYITAYRNPSDLMTKSGYCLVNLRSALEFIVALDGTMLSVPAQDFARLYQEAERAVDAL